MIEKYKSRRIRVALRHVLMSEWDPIGINDIPGAWDEYDCYLGEVFLLLERQALASEIEEYLRAVEVERMGLTAANGDPLTTYQRRMAAVDELQRTFNSQMLMD